VARCPNADPIYALADKFREQCLKAGYSLLWPNSPIWTVDSLSLIFNAFMDNLDSSDRPFLAKWKDQMAHVPKDVHKISVDINAFYYLFPSRISSGTKLGVIRELVSWKLGDEEPDYNMLKEAFRYGIGHTGPFYNTAKPWMLAFYLAFFKKVRAGEADPDDPVACKMLADKTLKEIPVNVISARHILLYLLFPDSFERIASQEHKNKIAASFKPNIGRANDIDEALLNVRGFLSEKLGRPNMDFYDPDIQSRWDSEESYKSYVPDSEGMETKESEASSENTHTDIQKALLQFGVELGLDVWVAKNDLGRITSPLSGHLRKELPMQLSGNAKSVIEHIDVLWLKGECIVAAFEVEHTTSVYSGLLRMSDLISIMPYLNIQLYIVSPENRRGTVCREMNRPAFKELGLPGKCRFISYSKLISELEAIGSKAKYLDWKIIEHISESCEPN